MTRIFRRSIISSLMVLSITGPAIAAEPVPLPVETLQKFHVPAPVPLPVETLSRFHVLAQAVTPATLLARADRAAAADREVSEGMQVVIGSFVEKSIRMAATDITGDNEALGIVAQDRTRALTALAFHRPANITELAAKLAAITEFSEDTERFALRVLVEDANRLAEGTR
jgi:hypothetical protein